MLISGGLPALEVTLRTPAALETIQEMAKIPGGYVGAGTVLTPADAEAAKKAGATFGVSPGATPRLLDACEANELPLMPGAATATKAMALLECGDTVQKFFSSRSQWRGERVESAWCPNAPDHLLPNRRNKSEKRLDYLKLPNVSCVGEGWVAPIHLLETENWAEIRALAAEGALLTN